MRRAISGGMLSTMMTGAFVAPGYRPPGYYIQDGVELEMQGIPYLSLTRDAVRTLALGDGWFGVVRSIGFDPAKAVDITYADGSMILALTGRLP